MAAVPGADGPGVALDSSNTNPLTGAIVATKRDQDLKPLHLP